jgi:hypothetical protein
MESGKEIGGSLEALDLRHGLGSSREDRESLEEEVDESLPFACLKALGSSSIAAEGFMMPKPPGERSRI